MSAVAPVPPREWTVPPSDVLLADGSIAVIRTVAARGPRAAARPARRRLRGHPAAALLHRQPRRRAGATSSTSSTRPTPTRPRWSPCVRGRVAGLATAEVMDRERAEVAFLVSDEDHGRGLGILLLEHLAALGRAHGLTRFEAEVLGRQLRHAPRVPRGRVRGLATDRGRRGVRRAAHRRVGRGARRRRPARVALGGPFAAAPAGARERRRGRRTPPRRRAGPGRPRRDPVGRVRRPAQRRAPARPTRWTACRRTPRSPRCRAPSTSWSWSCRPTRCRT